MNYLKSIDDAVSLLQTNLGSAIRVERVRLGLTQANVAKVAAISRATVIAAEAGQGVSSQNLFALITAVGLTFVTQAIKSVAEPSIFTSDIASSSATRVGQRPLLKALMAEERARMASLNK